MLHSSTPSDSTDKKRKESSTPAEGLTLEKRSKTDGNESDPHYLSLQNTLQSSTPDDISSFEEKIDVAITETLGDGSTGAIYKAIWKQQTIAIKHIAYGQVTSHPASIFRQKDTCLLEATHLKTITDANTPNVVKYLGHTIRNNNFFLFMSYVEGCCLDAYIAKTPVDTLNWEQRYNMMGDLAVAMKGVHALNFLHGDIKSPNVIINSSYQLVLCDFGSTSPLPAGHGGGSPAWKSPEALKGPQFTRTLTDKADIYSLGLVYHEIVSWNMVCTALKNQTHPQLFFYVTSGKRGEFPTDTPPKIAQLVRWCWQDDSTKRPSAAELHEELATPMSEQSVRLSNLSLNIAKHTR